MRLAPKFIVIFKFGGFKGILILGGPGAHGGLFFFDWILEIGYTQERLLPNALFTLVQLEKLFKDKPSRN